MNETGFVCLIQFQPDAARLESANVGLVLFYPTIRRLDIKMEDGVGRVQRFFGKGVDGPFLKDMKRALERRLRAEAASFAGSEDLAGFGRRLGNQLVLTPPRGIAVIDTYERLLESMFDKLVAEGPEET